MAARLIDEVVDALDEQTVVVPGTGTLDIVIPSLARSLAAVHEQRRALETQITQLLEAHPLSQVLASLPGVGIRAAAVLLVTVGDGTSFPLPPTSPPTPASPRPRKPRAPRSTANTPPEAATGDSNAPCSCPRSPPCTTHLPHLLQPLPSPREDPHTGPPPPHPAPHQRAVRDAPRPHPLPTQNPTPRLTNDIEAPPGTEQAVMNSPLASAGGRRGIRDAREEAKEAALTTMYELDPPDQLALQADGKLVECLAKQHFDGSAWDMFANELARYALPVLTAWLRDGRLTRTLAERGLPGVNPEYLDREDAQSLIIDAISRAVPSMRTSLQECRWDPAKGASLRSYFVGACIYQVPNLYRAHRRASRRRQEGEVLVSPADIQAVEDWRARRSTPDVESEVSSIPKR